MFPPDFSAAFPWVSASSNPATYFYYEGWNLIQEGPSLANASRNYLHGARVDEIVKQIRPTDWWERYFHYDARGHCSLQTDIWGNVVEQYDYDAFGQPYFYDWAGTNTGYSAWGNRFLFTGREYLSDLKLYDYRNRLYQPELGRFMQPDPQEFAAGDYNLYRYCHNDPVNKSDPTGLIEGSENNVRRRDGIDEEAKKSQDSHKWDFSARLDRAIREFTNKCARYVHDILKKAGASPPTVKDRETGQQRSATAAELATQRFQNWRILKANESAQRGDIGAYVISGYHPEYTGHAGIITSGVGPSLDGTPILSNESVHGDAGVYPISGQFDRALNPSVVIQRYTGE